MVQMNGLPQSQSFTNCPSPSQDWGPHVRLKPVIRLASDFSPLSLTQSCGFYYHFQVCLWRIRIGGVTVITTDRTKRALLPLWWARSQERGEPGANAHTAANTQLCKQESGCSQFLLFNGLIIIPDASKKVCCSCLQENNLIV